MIQRSMEMEPLIGGGTKTEKETERGERKKERRKRRKKRKERGFNKERDRDERVKHGCSG